MSSSSTGGSMLSWDGMLDGIWSISKKGANSATTWSKFVRAFYILFYPLLLCDACILPVSPPHASVEARRYPINGTFITLPWCIYYGFFISMVTRPDTRSLPGSGRHTEKDGLFSWSQFHSKARGAKNYGIFIELLFLYDHEHLNRVVVERVQNQPPLLISFFLPPQPSLYPSPSLPSTSFTDSPWHVSLEFVLDLPTWSFIICLFDFRQEPEKVCLSWQG